MGPRNVAEQALLDDSQLTIYTIGHSSVSSQDLISTLVEHQIILVVDVRSMPYSQHTPQFNRETLEAALRRAGIGYRFAGDYLGGRPTDPTCYKSGVVPDGKADYLHVVDYDEVAKRPWFLKGIARLEQLAREGRVAVMCSEEDPRLCHRQHLIARYLVSTGARVLHIRHRSRPGKLEDSADLPTLADAEEGEQLALPGFGGWDG